MIDKLRDCIEKYPDLPIVAMVDGDIVEPDSSLYWLGSISNVIVDEIGIVGERYYDCREDFKDAYYDKYDEELTARFNYRPCLSVASTKWDSYTDEEIRINEVAGARLEAYLEEMADRYMQKAIVLYIREPNSELFKEAVYD